MTEVKDRTSCDYVGVDGRVYCSGGCPQARTQCLFAEALATDPAECVFWAGGSVCGGTAAGKHARAKGATRTALEANRRYELQGNVVIKASDALGAAQAERQRLMDELRVAQDAATAEGTKTPVVASVTVRAHSSLMLILGFQLALPTPTPAITMVPSDQWHVSAGRWKFFREHVLSDTGWSVAQWVKGALASALEAGFAVDVEPLRASLSTLRQQVDEITDQFDLVIRDLDEKEKTK